MLIFTLTVVSGIIAYWIAYTIVNPPQELLLPLAILTYLGSIVCGVIWEFTKR